MKKIILLILVLFIPTNVCAKNWYEGGTLHSKSALEWQVASYENKLATCSDFVSTTWQNKSFKPEIQSKITSMDVVKVLSKELVKALDTALAKDPDPKKNEMMYANQTVSSSVAMLMVMMGWVEL